MAADVESAALMRPSSPRLAAARDVVRRLLSDPYTVAGLSIYVVFTLGALFADAFAPPDPTEFLFRANGRAAETRPLGKGFTPGTTNPAREIYPQLVYGSRSA